MRISFKCHEEPCHLLACGTGRTGVWLKAHDVGALDGVDLTLAMVAKARERGIYTRLLEEDIRPTSLPAQADDVATTMLADEHLASLAPLYTEVARLVAAGGLVCGIFRESQRPHRGVIASY